MNFYTGKACMPDIIQPASLWLCLPSHSQSNTGADFGLFNMDMIDTDQINFCY